MIELRGVSKRFGDFLAVDAVDLLVAAGEFLTLLGPSGCGKTTLLRMISGFETPTSGSVLLGGQDVTRLPPYRRDVNQVFQSYALFPHLNVWDNVAFGLRMKRVRKPELTRRVEQAIGLVSLAGFEARKPGQLSGGQKQRVALARALVCEPKVLLLDEPLAALDAKLRHAMQLELKRLQSRLGITFLFVTHDQEEALVMSDRIAVINKGRIEQIGPAQEIYHCPRTAFAADFIGQANVLPARVLSWENGVARLICREELELEICCDRAQPGSDCVVSIRPEKIALSFDRERSGEVAVAGEERFGVTFPVIVRETIFRGPAQQVLLRTPGGVELSALHGQSGGAPKAFTPGQRLFATIRREDVVMLSA